jgi:hypothetical protein
MVADLLMPLMQLVSYDHKEDFRQFVIGRMIQKTCQADGRCFESLQDILLEALLREGILDRNSYLVALQRGS